MRSSLRQVGLTLACFALSALFCACFDDAPHVSPADQSVPALVALAQSFHEQADIAVEANRDDDAMRAMQELIAALERYEVGRPEALDLGMDAFGRLARLQLENGLMDEALLTANAGLAFGESRAQESLFAGYLLQVRGDALRSRGDMRGAVQAHKDAILVFKRVLDARAPAKGAAP